MKLTLKDKLALIFTSAGTQRAVASLVGISHQKVGRILRAGEPGEMPLDSRAMRDPGLIEAVDQAFRIHKEVARAQARADDLPFVPEVPIYYRRMPHLDGVPGDRVEAIRMHWLPDRLKWTWLANIQPSGKFYHVSVGSVINLATYLRGRFKTITHEVVTGRMQTPYFAFEPKHDIEGVLRGIIARLKTKHEPATGDQGTSLADRFLLQVDTRHDRDIRYRSAHPFPAKTKRRKARGAKARRR